MTSADRLENWPQANFRLATGLLLVAVFFFYQALFLSYRPYEIDNPWSLSFSYGYGHAHIPDDQFMSVPFPAGQDGTYLFGKLAAMVQTVTLEPFHWQQRNAEALSALLTVLALGCWAEVLRRCGATRTAIICFLVVAAVSDPFVHAAERFRYEPLTLLLASAGLLCALRGCTFAAVLLALLPLETQPAAMFAAIPVFALLWNRRRGSLSRMVLEASAALAVFLMMEFALHPMMLHLGKLRSRIESAPPGLMAPSRLGLLYYFVVRQHLPETLFFGGLLLLLLVPSVHKNYLPLPGNFSWLLQSLAAILLLNPLFPHVNFAYDLLLYVVLVAAAAVGLRTARAQVFFAIGAMALFLPQYVGLAWLNRGQGYSDADIRKVTGAIAAAEHAEGLPDERAEIIGDYGLWFAHPDHFHANTLNNYRFFPQANLLLCYNAPMRGVSQPTMMKCDDFRAYFPERKLLDTEIVRGNTLFLYGINNPQQDITSQRN